MIVGILRKDEVEEDDEGSESEVEEWLEIRMRLVKVSRVESREGRKGGAREWVLES